jgi:hypothetical protein
MAGGENKDLKDIVEKDSDLTFAEYSKLSLVIVMAQTKGAMLELGKKMTTAMKKSTVTFNNPNVRMTDKEKQELQKQIEKADQELKAQEGKLNIIRENYEVIKEVKARMEE